MGPLDHVGIAVRRLDEGIARYQLLGLGPESIEDLPAEGVRAAFLPAGDVRLELLESTRADSAIATFLERRGEGLHHVAFQVDDVREAIASAEIAGFRLVDREPRRGARGRLVAFVHPKSVHGVLVELVQPPTSRER
ncbi:MAG TPA: methylmalonyl-CoA epimerase [Thermoplasmata archaeon]|nr:methylmalonyl-CoA epimerase [Thermoplasmata archaeon]